MKRVSIILIPSAYGVVCGFLFFIQPCPFGLTTDEARSLYGADLGDTFWVDRYCVEIEKCNDDDCDGDYGYYTCSLHSIRTANPNPQEFGKSRCTYEWPTSVDCECQSTNLEWTCSTVFDSCWYDETEEVCVEAEDPGAYGIERAPQFCNSDCDLEGGEL